MPLFDWGMGDLSRLLLGSGLVHGMGDESTAAIARDMFHRGIQPDEEDEARLARSRWLEENRAEYSFPCGLVPSPEPGPQEPQLNVLPMMRRQVAAIVAAVLPSDVVFLLDQESEDIVELGRLPRTSISEADVVDPAGAHLPEPIDETFEPDRPAFAVLRWSNEGVDDEERFAFRSVWLAWKAARKLLGARQG